MNDENTFHVDMNLAVAREGTPSDIYDEIADQLDEAQGHIFSGEGSEAFVVIRIVK